MCFLLFDLLCSDRVSCVQLIIPSFFFDELVVGPTLDDASLFQDHDTVGVLDRGQTVGDDEGGAPFHQRIHSRLHEGFGSGVDGRSSLVQDQYRRISHSCPGNGEELSLPLT